MSGSRPTRHELERRLRDAEETLLAIRTGAVDALVVDTTTGSRIFKLEGADAFYRVLVEELPIGVTGLDARGTILFANPCLCEMLELREGEILGRRFAELVGPSGRRAALRAIERGDANAVHQIGELVRGSGLTFAVDVLMRAMDGQSDTTYCVIVEDISERKALEDRLRALADHDPLTGLHNRRRLLELLDRDLDQARRYDRRMAVLLLDVDNLKIINDRYGHAVGDQALLAVAETLCSRVRSSDLVARLGGDEFVAVLGQADEQAALAVADEVRRRLRAVSPPTVRVSIGVLAPRTWRDLSADAALAAADIPLYEAKQRGGDQSRVYSGQARSGLSWVAEVRAALAEDRLVLYQQPIVDLTTGETVRYELLLRMRSRTGEMIPPVAFLPSAERFGQITEIDDWVNAQALRLAAGGECVAVNLSSASVTDGAFIDALRDAVAGGLPAGRVTYEITETAIVTNITAVQRVAAELADLGSALALDDFGTGFSTLTYLKQIPAHFIKIDREFVRDIVDDVTDQEVVKGIVAIARSLDKQTIAEGVESRETLELLRSYGVDFAQGYYLGRPEPVPSPAVMVSVTASSPAGAAKPRASAR